MKKILLLPDDLHLDAVHRAKGMRRSFCDYVRYLIERDVSRAKEQGFFPPNRPTSYTKQKRTYKPKREEF